MMYALGLSRRLVLWGALLVTLSGCVTVPDEPAALRSDEERDRIAALNFQLGVGYMSNQRWDVAQEKLQKAIEYNDELVEAHNALAVLYEETSELTLARQQYERTLALDPDYALARINYARLLCNHGDPERGEAQYLIAIHSEKLQQPWMAYTGAGNCARLQGNYERAEAYYQQALTINRLLPDTLWELATLYYQTERPQEAKEVLARLHQRTRPSAPTLWLAINIEQALGNVQRQIVLEQQLVEQFPNSPEAQRIQ